MRRSCGVVAIFGAVVVAGGLGRTGAPRPSHGPAGRPGGVRVCRTGRRR